MSISKTSKTLLALYLTELASHPLRTKAFTSGTLSFLQEISSSAIAKVPVQKSSKETPFLLRLLANYYVDSKAFKMALYGFLVSAPLGHVLTGALQKAFAGKTSPAAKIGQLLASNLVVAPIQASAYLASVAVINGASSVDGVLKTLKLGLPPLLKIQWIVSPLTLAFATKFVDPALWVPFFNLVQFVVGTYFNAKVKRMRLNAAKRDSNRKDEKEL